MRGSPEDHQLYGDPPLAPGLCGRVIVRTYSKSIVGNGEAPRRIVTPGGLVEITQWITAEPQYQPRGSAGAG